MQTVLSPIQWGNTTLVLDHQSFEDAYTRGRQYYFEDENEEDDGCEYSAFSHSVEDLLY